MTISLLLLTLMKAGILLGSALLFCQVARRTSAAVKHLVCLAALIGALLLPILAAVLPQWIPVASIDPAADVAGQPGAPVLFHLWAAGVVLLALRGSRRLLAVRRVLAEGREVRDARLLGVAIEARRELGTKVPIRVLTSAAFRVPMTTGILRPTLLLPEDAVEWSLPRLRAILLHETAHLARRDALTGVVAAASCALWWFLPLSWLVAARLRLFREVACDDRVIERGARSSGYAAMLLDCFERFRGERPLLAGAAVLGNQRELHHRVQCLVDARTCRQAPPRRALTVVLALALLTLGLASAGRASATPAGRSCSHCNRVHLPRSVSVTLEVHANVGSERR